MSVNIGRFNRPLTYNYGYDQLNRLVSMDAYDGLNSSTNQWQFGAALDEYKERVSYDANGNILTYLRNGTTQGGHQLAMDNLTYGYKPGTNQLDHVDDGVSASNYTEDIDDQGSGNYSYDEIGNLTGDVAEGLTVTWNVYGKIATINKAANGPTPAKSISSSYDASGNRIGKSVTVSSVITSTWYVRDGMGNVMAVYENRNQEVNSGHLSQIEVDIYGSSRLGIWKSSRDVEQWLSAPVTSMPGITGGGIAIIERRTEKVYELSNHLGNVLVGLTDRKKEVASGSNSSVISYYVGDVMIAQDYYPFGMMMMGRKYSASDLYRYGFNGQEKSNEVKGEGNSYTAEFWEYDPRTGTRWNVDPKADQRVELSPYNSMSNDPINRVDPDGALDDWVRTSDGQMLWDDKVTDQASATQRYGDGATYRAPGYSYTAKSGESVSLGTNRAFTIDGVAHIAVNSTNPYDPGTFTYWNYTNGRNYDTQVEAYKAWQSNSGYHPGEGFWDRTFRVLAYGSMEARRDYAAGGMNMYGGYGALAKTANATEGAADAYAAVGTSEIQFAKGGAKTFFEGAKYSDKVLRQMGKADDIYHAFPKSVDGFATKFGKWSTQAGADGKTYQWLKMPGSYGGKTGVFEYTKDANGLINHRFFRVTP